MAEACDSCGDPVGDALARTVRLSVDRSQVDVQRLCPECFADWVNRYDQEMRQRRDEDDDGTIIVD